MTIETPFKLKYETDKICISENNNRITELFPLDYKQSLNNICIKLNQQYNELQNTEQIIQNQYNTINNLTIQNTKLKHEIINIIEKHYGE